MITTICKVCGGTIENICLTSMPPIHQEKCRKCGRVVSTRTEENRVIVK